MKTDYNKILSVYEESPHFPNTERNKMCFFQYRTFESFWSIIKSDCFWATNARFSNDLAEQRFGANVMSNMLKYNNINKPFNELNENYILCFCAEDDKLSQWRGYASEGGVSIGFNYMSPITFSIAKKDTTVEKNRKNNDYIEDFIIINPVCYLPPIENNYSEESKRIYIEDCYKKIGYGQGASENKHPDTFRKEITTIAPYIKHEGFKDENEWRLVFSNKDGILDSCIRYRTATSSNVQLPYIAVYPGSISWDNKDCNIRVFVPESYYAEELCEKIREKLPVQNRVENCALTREKNLDLRDDFCYGCSRRCLENGFDINLKCRYAAGQEDIGVAVPNDECSIIISQGKDQEHVFKIIHALMQNENDKYQKMGLKKIPVWCEGHLPIRSITVGPCPNQKEMEESIRHYCSHIHWLKDVEIKTSQIPFRRNF